MVSRKEIRYLVLALPFFSLLIGYTLAAISAFIKKHSQTKIAPTAFMCLIILLVFLPFPRSLNIERPPKFEMEAQNIMNKNQLKGIVLTSHPFLHSYLDTPVVNFGGMEHAEEIYRRYQGKYDLIYLNDCNLNCAPEDLSCLNRKKALLQRIAQENVEIFKRLCVFAGRECTALIYLQHA